MKCVYHIIPIFKVRPGELEVDMGDVNRENFKYIIIVNGAEEDVSVVTEEIIVLKAAKAVEHVVSAHIMAVDNHVLVLAA